MTDSEKLRDSLTTMITERSPAMETPAGEKSHKEILVLWNEFYSRAFAVVNDLQCFENIGTAKIDGEKGGPT